MRSPITTLNLGVLASATGIRPLKSQSMSPDRWSTDSRYLNLYIRLTMITYRQVVFLQAMYSSFAKFVFRSPLRRFQANFYKHSLFTPDSAHTQCPSMSKCSKLILYNTWYKLFCTYMYSYIYTYMYSVYVQFDVCHLFNIIFYN